jgi:excisionase family DNA binding protein
MGTSREVERIERTKTIGGNGAVNRREGTGAPLRLPLLSPTDLASYLGVPVATIYRWRSYGYGPMGIRVGRHVRYRVEDVDQWLEAQRRDRA